MMKMMKTPGGNFIGSPYVEDVIRYVKATGSHFFDADTMRFFGTPRRSLAMVGTFVMIGADFARDTDQYWIRTFDESGRSSSGQRFATRKAAYKGAYALVESMSGDVVRIADLPIPPTQRHRARVI